MRPPRSRLEVPAEQGGNAPLGAEIGREQTTPLRTVSGVPCPQRLPGDGRRIETSLARRKAPTSRPRAESVRSRDQVVEPDSRFGVTGPTSVGDRDHRGEPVHQLRRPAALAHRVRRLAAFTPAAETAPPSIAAAVESLGPPAPNTPLTSSASFAPGA